VKADITRSTFDPGKQFTRVLMQQGRVQLDSDWNEQTSILLHYMQTLAADVIGPHGGPGDHLGFRIVTDVNSIPYDELQYLSDEERSLVENLENGDFAIGKGRYYVEGVLCENGSYVTFTDQPGLPGQQPPEYYSYLVYLDVWEQHVTAVEDAGIREVALGGPDTATRARVVWQVKVDDGSGDSGEGYGARLDPGNVENEWEKWLNRWQPINRGELMAKSREDAGEDEDPCVVSPEARYRGVENQLYRVEIHRPGAALGSADDSDTTFSPESGGETTERTTSIATFKWSRDNGSVTFPIRDLDGSVVTLESLGRDDRSGLRVGDLVEIVDEDYVLRGGARPLLRVEEIDAAGMRVTLSGEPAPDVGRNPDRHPLLRRWDHGSDASRDGAAGYDTIPLEEDTWLTLEDGVQIYFRSDSIRSDSTDPHEYRTGDYWLIPARTATGDVEWPGAVGQPEALPPHGVQHHYAPLAIIMGGYPQSDCRCSFDRLGVCPPPADNH
jgi:hypothetical protein